MDDIREKLDEEIDARLEKLKTIKSKEERAEEVRQLTELYKLRLDDKKLDNEKDIQARNRKLETAGLIIPNGILVGTIIAGFFYEKNGVFVRSDTLRRALNFVKPSRFIKMFR